MDIPKCADLLYSAEKEIKGIEMLTLTYPEMTVADGYEIQFLNIKRKLSEGEKLTGAKLGLTAKPVQAMLGAEEPVFGFLTDAMAVVDGASLDFDHFIGPKVEGEVAFILKKALKGPGISEADIYEACDFVVPALEIIDSRIKDWKVKLPDMIADNTSAIGYVLGSKLTPIREIDMQETVMHYYKNDQEIGSGTTKAVLGSPAGAVAWLANKLSEYDLDLPEGSIILAGSLLPPVFAFRGDTIKADFEGMGSVSVTFK